MKWSLTHFAEQSVKQINHLNSLLLHRVPLSQSDCVLKRLTVFSKRVEIDGDTEWRSGFVLPPVTTANGTGFVVIDTQMRTQDIPDLFRLFYQLRFVFQQRKDCYLDRRNSRVEAHHHSTLQLSLFVGRLVFRISITKQRQRQAIHPSTRLNHMWHVIAFT